MNSSPNSCSTCGTLTKFKCHCSAWGYPELYFCTAECKKDHLKDHLMMNPSLGKRKTSDDAIEVPKKPNLKLSSFGTQNKKKNPFLSKPDSSKSASGCSKSLTGTVSKKKDFSTSPNSSKEENEAILVEDIHRNESTDENDKEKVKKKEKGPLLVIAAMTDRQKTRKTNDLMKMIREALGDVKIMRPAWNILLKTVSTDENVKIKKKWMFKSTDVAENAVSSQVKRRYTKVVQGLRVIEAMRPDLMFQLVTDKPKGTGKVTAHQYLSESDRQEVVAVEDVSMADDVETNVEIDQDEEDELLPFVNNEESAEECRICKLIIQKEEVALFCGTGKRSDNHFGCHVRCLGFYKVEKGDKFHKDLSVHYRCPDHGD